MSQEQSGSKSTESDSEYQRKHFTLTEEALNILEEESEQETSGNKSAYVRRTIRAYQDREEIQQLQKVIVELQRKIDSFAESEGTHQLTTTSAEATHRSDQLQTQVVGSSPDSSSPPRQEEDSELAIKLMPELPAPGAEPVKLGVLAINQNRKLSEVCNALELLEQKSAVERVNTSDGIAFRRSSSGSQD